MGEHPAGWLVDRFFLEFFGLHSIPSSWTIPRVPDIQQKLIKVRVLSGLGLSVFQPKSSFYRRMYSVAGSIHPGDGDT